MVNSGELAFIYKIKSVHFVGQEGVYEQARERGLGAVMFILTIHHSIIFLP